MKSSDKIIKVTISQSLLVKSKEECTQAINRCKTKYGEQGRKQGSTQGTETQRNWISQELLEVIESIPYHEHFIHMHDGALPQDRSLTRGQRDYISRNTACTSGDCCNHFPSFTELVT